VLGPESPSPWRRTKCPPVSSGPGHGAVHPGANGRHNELRGLGPSSHPSAFRGQPGSDEAPGLPQYGQAARAFTYEPMTPPRLFRKVDLTLFYYFYFLKKQSKTVWMLETIQNPKLHTPYTRSRPGGLCVGLRLQRAAVKRYRRYRRLDQGSWPLSSDPTLVNGTSGTGNLLRSRGLSCKPGNQRRPCITPYASYLLSNAVNLLYRMTSKVLCAIWVNASESNCFHWEMLKVLRQQKCFLAPSETI